MTPISSVEVTAPELYVINSALLSFGYQNLLHLLIILLAFRNFWVYWGIGVYSNLR